MTTNFTQALMLTRKSVRVDGMGRWGEIRSVPLEGEFRQLALIVAGTDWTDEVIASAHEQAQAGYRPWFCQPCAGEVCRRCGSPTGVGPGSTVVYDDGREAYRSIVMGEAAGCTNPDCGNYDNVLDSGS